ncbi:MFS transporter [Pseudomonas sp. S1(2024)]|uniref:MFS transporter n=1 Tax=Pseudomonas sp. S1(2024) TaxID=3390191 RepID=UPI00397BB99B
MALKSHPGSHQLRILFSVGFLYLSFGIYFGLLEQGVPPILLDRGLDLTSMGWVIALYIPFGLTFLWAPMIDGKALPWLGYRMGWIVLSQLVSSLLLIVIAFAGAASAKLLFGLGIVACIAIATMDLTLDALAVDIVGPRYRAMAAGLKVAALGLGGLIGGGVLVGSFDQLGWTGTFLVTAVIPLLILLPVLSLMPEDKPRAMSAMPASILITFCRPGALRQIVLLSLSTTATVALVYFQRPILVEMGVPLSDIGWGLGTLAPIANSIAALAVAPILARTAPVKALALLVILSVIFSIGTVVSISATSSRAVMVWSLLQGIGSSALSVIIYALILKWSSQEQSATDYAVLCGISRLLATVTLMAVPQALPYLNWAGFYAITIGTLLVVTFLIRREVAHLAEVGP